MTTPVQATVTPEDIREAIALSCLPETKYAEKVAARQAIAQAIASAREAGRREAFGEAATLRDKIAEQRRQLSIAKDAQHERNLELDALHWVWCDGGCQGGVHRWLHSSELTEEIVALAERNARRLRAWLANKAGKDAARGRAPVVAAEASMSVAPQKDTANRPDTSIATPGVEVLVKALSEVIDQDPFRKPGVLCAGCLRDKSRGHNRGCLFTVASRALAEYAAQLTGEGAA